MRNFKLLLEYDGTNFVGWQRQDNGRSVQGEIERVLSQVLQEGVSVIGAGRTDAGVHARGQVANFRSETKLCPNDILGGFNALLPDDVVVYDVEEVPVEFHARYSARERAYSYTISRRPIAVMRNYAWFVKYRLDMSLMQMAAEMIVGEHDFESFCKTASAVDHHRCTVSVSRWDDDGAFLQYEIRANRFLHGMVRALVGSMVDVGRGYRTVEEFRAIIGAKDRTEAGMAAPARGLCLESVAYEMSEHIK
jgi:tRNA pseudouridine38-40 synthase